MIALVTTHEARGHDKDLGILSRALDACGAKWEIVDWDDQTIDWSQFDIAVLRSTWDYYERLGEFLVWARGVGARTRLFNPLDIVQWNVDKRYLIDLAGASIDVMPTMFVSRPTDLAAVDLTRDVIGERVIAQFGELHPKVLALDAAVAKLKEFATTKFDQSVEIHMRLGVDPKQADQIIRGSIVLPHGIGKSQRVVVFAKGDLAEAARILDEYAALGISLCMPHQCTTDAFVDRKTRSLQGIEVYLRMIRERGMIPGLSTHMPETPPYADASGLDVATYIQIYNGAGFLMQIEIDWVQRMIWNAKKPVITIKPLAAGKLPPLVGLSFVWSTLRDCDMVCVGTSTAQEAEEVVELSLALLERRLPRVELQETRSKASLKA